MPGSDRPPGVPRPPLAYRITPRQWLAADVAIAVLTMAVMIFGLRLLHAPRFVTPRADVAVAGVAASLPVAVRRLWPLPVLAVVTVAVSVLTAIGRAELTSDLMLGMAIYMAAVRLPRPVSVATLVAVEATILAGLLTAAATAHAQNVMLHSMLAAAAMWFVGAGVRERRRYQAGLAAQAAEHRRAETERGRHALQEERLRIARELHDILAHSLSVVTVQAGVGRRVGAAHPAEALRALSAVEEASRGALDELRHILGLLRGDDGPGLPGLAGQPPREPALTPAPGLRDLGDLAAMVGSAGTPVSLSVTGEADQVTPAAGLTAYRIVQEALTNVVRHAPGAQAAVRVGIGPAGVRIRVTDTGRTVPAPAGDGPGGHGIAGMRERAAVFGGTLDAGPLPGGGFQVLAFLPVPATAAGRVA
jgi:signal transduction histidine kinase